MMASVISSNWYFDFISPFAYLQLAQFSKLPSSLKITPVPVVFSGLLKHWGQLGPAEIPSKRRFVYRFFKWKADQINLPFTMPPKHPYNPLPSLRLCVAAGAKVEQVIAIFNVIYVQGLQLDSIEGINAMAEALSIDNPQAVLSDKAVKITLRDNTKKAIAEGVFGVPTFTIGNELFWGGDATKMMLDYINCSELFETAEMKRISSMPMGLTRR
jgi:2-hydroxychromene-2-carboxylate isomerase